jgi:spermidine synthase
MSSAAAQIVLLREFLSVFQGNELVYGILLANWMVLTGAGALAGHSVLGRFPRDIPFRSVLLSIGFLPIVSVFLLRTFRDSVFIPGSMIDLVQVVLASFVLAAPFCLVSGAAFVLCAAGLSQGTGRNSIASVYVWESAGSVAGGVVFGLLLATLLDAFQILALLAAVDLGILILVGRSRSMSSAGRACVFLVCLVPLAGVFLALDSVTRRALFAGQEVLYYKDTPYGNLTVTRQREQLNVFENMVLMFSTGDVAANEENVHYAMAQRPSPRTVLLIGGGISGTTMEVLKYGVDRLDYVEPNPWVIRIGRRFTATLGDPRIHVLEEDARRFVRSTGERYDAVLVNLPDPSTAQLNRFYTLDFVRDVRSVLNAGGVLSLSLLPSTEYQGEESRRITSTLFTTLRTVFPHVRIVPGMRNYFLTSDAPLDVRIGMLVEVRGVNTAYVNRYYLDDRLVERRSAGLMAGLDTLASTNTDFAPVCYFRQAAYWLSYFGFDPGPWIAGAGIAAVLLIFWRFSAVDAGIFAGGFTASSVEIVLLLALQVMCGSLYQMTGAIISVFMAGLAAGAFCARRRVVRPDLGLFVRVQLLVAAFCIVLPAILIWLKGLREVSALVYGVILFLTFFLACLGGVEFVIASRVRGGSAGAVASRLYGLDLVGSAFGALLASVYMIPLLGIQSTSVVSGLVSAGGALVCLAARRGYRVPEVIHE